MNCGLCSKTTIVCSVPVLGYKRDKRRSDFFGSADYGYCASRHLRYFGYQLVSVVVTLAGLIVRYELSALIPIACRRRYWRSATVAIALPTKALSVR